ncbi:hypothetical protein AZ55_09160 [Mycobacterium tuberculosis CWCFVRF MDRTB 670]|nr:hypothetical protein AZ55_09160 [Mycobacterium tuberculosis CWCFVRF MDRTB 670]
MSLALLGADRSLSISEVLATVRPLASYIAARNWAVAGGRRSDESLDDPVDLASDGCFRRGELDAPSPRA